MTWPEFAVVVLGTAAATLLTGSARPWARRRVRALLPSRTPPRRRRGGARLRRAVLLWGVPAVPALTLLVVVGPLSAVVAGLPIGAALRWRLARGDGAAGGAARSVAGLPIAVDLLVAGLRAGGTMADVLAAVADAVGDGPAGRAFGQVAEQVRLGAEPGAAWGGTAHPPEFAAVGRALARAARTGAPVADILERQAAEIRAALRSRAQASTQRLGVLAVIPLGLCFLPAFVLIGVVPLAAGLLTGLGT
ncbi:type II secretion system F family protein [Streptomonospora nanhaiensis]|nr:type II secretion system F family protein [Streptomonospora nanhaiensis]MBV2366790.1 type II secretion system F family protein [Streptomonospora nanhaiensis]